MAMAADPTVANLVDEAFLLSGYKGASTTIKDRATNRWMEEIKGDLYLSSTTHEELQATQETVTTEGNQRYDVPTDYGDVISVTLLDGSDDERATARGGSASSITLAANDGASDTAGRIGKEILLTGGAGVGQVRTITAFNTTTKVATVDQNFSTIPDATTTYLIVTRYQPLVVHPMALGVDTYTHQTYRGAPVQAAFHDRQWYVLPVPDKSTYGLRMRYYLDLLRLDLASTRYLRIIKQWENVFMAGLVARIHKNFDDDRYRDSREEYVGLLQALGAKQTTLTHVAFRAF